MKKQTEEKPHGEDFWANSHSQKKSPLEQFKEWFMSVVSGVPPPLPHIQIQKFTQNHPLRLGQFSNVPALN
jgi:hypothetical protein